MINRKKSDRPKIKVMVQKKKANSKEKGIPKGNKQTSTQFFLQGTTFFLTYKGISDSGLKLEKNGLANYLLNQNPNDLKLRPFKYLVCMQTYDDGTPHYHAILIYEKRKQITRQSYYDYLGIHPNIQTMRNMKAALDYVYKEDTDPVSNMDIVQEKRVARAKDSSSLFELLDEQMKKDPFNFDYLMYCHNHNLFKEIYKTNYTKAINLLKGSQQATCRALLTNLPGLVPITRQHIESVLTPKELVKYDAFTGYAKIVAHINAITAFPNKSESSRLPNKTKHLYLSGPSDIGKSALVNHLPSEEHSAPGLDHYFSTYYLNVSERYFPPYTDYMSSLVYWDQFVIDSSIFPKRRYNELLTYLAGSPTQLPIKGRSPVRRYDNPKHIVTSNMTLKQQVDKTFNSPQSRSMALANLRSRFEEINIPKGYDLHFLRKLFNSPA